MVAVGEIALRAAGDREIVTTEQAIAQVQEWQQEIAQPGGDVVRVTELDLSCRAWRRGILVDHIQPFLGRNVVPTIQVLKIDDTIASLPTADGLATIEFFSQVFGAAPYLVHVDLSENALGIRAMETLGQLFARRLTRLRLYKCGLDEDSAQILLQELGPHAGVLEVLALGENLIGENGAPHIGLLLQSCPNLVVFEYSDCRPLRQGTMHICQGLQWTPHLQRLDLAQASLGNGDDATDPVHLLAVVLRGLRDLRALILKDGSLESTGLNLVLNAVAAAGAQLRLLDVAWNDLGDIGAGVLVPFLGNNGQPELRNVVLEGNDLGFAGLQQLVPFLQTDQVEQLDLSSNLLEGDAAQLIIDALPNMRNLTTFNLKENQLSVQTAARLRELYPFVEVDEDDTHGEDKEEGEDEEEDEDEEGDEDENEEEDEDEDEEEHEDEDEEEDQDEDEDEGENKDEDDDELAAQL